MPLLPERSDQESESYKHSAPPEQEPHTVGTVHRAGISQSKEQESQTIENSAPPEQEPHTSDAIRGALIPT